MLKKLTKVLCILMLGIGIIQLNIKKTEAKTLVQDKMVSIAMKEKGSRYKKKYGPSPWCTAFVNWSARKAKVSTKVIPNATNSTTMYKKLLKCGAKVVKKPKKGDIVFYKRSSKSNSMMHTALMTSSTMSIHGNYSHKVSYIKATDYRAGKGKIAKNRIVYVRPNYPSAPAKPQLKTATMSKETVTLSWKKVSHATSYTIYMKNADNKVVYQKNIKSTLSKYSFIFDNKKYGIYSIAIKANNSIGSSPLSSIKKIQYINPVLREGETKIKIGSNNQSFFDNLNIFS